MILGGGDGGAVDGSLGPVRLQNLEILRVHEFGRVIFGGGDDHDLV